MMLELLGTRIISPYYGGGLYVWSSLITVALISLSIGYWLGGWLADRVPRADFLYVLIFVAGITVVLIPALGPAVARTTMRLGLALGTLSSAFLLFSIPLLLLAMVTPYALRLQTRQLTSVGVTAGRLYAVSTMGSFVGTILTGFLLIPNMGVKSIAWLLVAALWVVSAIHFLTVRRLSIGILILLLSAGALFVHPNSPLQEGVVYQTDSFYGELKVLDVRGDRYLLIDGAPQTVIDKRTGIPLLKYVHYLNFLHLLNPEARTMLLIGLGGGSIPAHFRRHGLNMDLVEIDPRMKEVAERFFGFKAEPDCVHFEDGRYYIQRTDKRYDFVILDVYSGDAVPVHLFTYEVFQAIDSILSRGGILAVNFVGFVSGPNSLAPKSVYRTLKQVFPFVDTYFTEKGEELGNILFFASSAKLEPRIQPDDLEAELHRIALRQMLERVVHFQEDQGFLLTDSHNPMEILTMGTSRAWREETQAVLKVQ